MVTARGFLRGVLDTGDCIAKQYMFALVSNSLDTDLEFALLTHNFLCLFHIDTGKLDTDIPRDVIHASQSIDLCILGSKGVDLVFKNALDIFCSCL